MVSRRTKVGIAVVVIIIVVLVGASAAVYYSQQNSAAGIFARAGAPSEQEIETRIMQASSNPEDDRRWNSILNSCMELYRLGSNLYEDDCDGRAMIEARDSFCQIGSGELLRCDQNSVLGKKFQSYLNVIGYTS